MPEFLTITCNIFAYYLIVTKQPYPSTDMNIPKASFYYFETWRLGM